MIPAAWPWVVCAYRYDSDYRAPREGFGAEGLLPHAAAEIARARVYVFDWGRSELNTPSMHQALSPHDQEERDKHWGYYWCVSCHCCHMATVAESIARTSHPPLAPTHPPTHPPED